MIALDSSSLIAHSQREPGRVPAAVGVVMTALDHDVALLTVDRDFQRFAKATGLRLA